MNNEMHATITTALIAWLIHKHNNLVMPNVTILKSPWESDVISVTQAYYWHEYEIKTTAQDYRKDFEKRISRFCRESYHNPSKHGVYTSVYCPEWGRTAIPIPKSFSFVLPRGVINENHIPSHCGFIEYADQKISVVRKAPTLHSPTKLSQEQIYNLAQKAAQRCVHYGERP